LGECYGKTDWQAKKVRIVQRLLVRTRMTLKWIAEELQVGAWTHVSNLLSR
jgi:hypothetical protein